MATQLDITELAAQLLERQPVPLAILDEELQIAFANDSFLSLTGMALNSALGWPFTEFLTDQDSRDEVVRSMSKTAGTVPDIISELVTPNLATRARRLVRWQGELLQHNDRQYHLIVGTDITDLNAVSAELQDTQEQLRAILAAEENSVITITEGGKIHSFSPSAEKMFGYAAKEVLRKNVTTLMPSPYREEHDQYLHRYLETGEKKIIGIGREVTAQRKDGSQFPIFLAVDELRQGKERFFTAIIKDLTIQKQLESIQSVYQHLLEDLAGGADLTAIMSLLARNCATIIPGAAINIMVADNRRQKMSVSASSGLAVDFSEKMEKIAVSSDTCPCSDCFQSGELVTVANVGISKYIGPWRDAMAASSFVSCWAYPIQSTNNQPVGAVCLYFDEFREPSVQDVTILKDLARLASVAIERSRDQELLRQSQKMESIGMLTGGLAHDFNNLLTVIQGNLEILESKLTAPGQVEAAREALDAVQQGADLTKRMLTFARRQTINPKTVDLNATILDLNKILSRTLGENIELTTSLAASVWPVHIDPGQFQDTLINLCINARDAMPGGGRLQIRTENCEFPVRPVGIFGELAAGSYVCVSVTDNGVGIGDDDMKLIFDPFFTTKQTGQGSGLGLSMVYGFVTRANGGVTVYSEPGKGTTFSLYLPKTDPESELSNTASQTQSDELPTGTEKVLLVEDDDRVRKITAQRLANLGYDVVTAENGEIGLQYYLAEGDFDIVFTDVIMPGSLTGPQMAEKILEQDPDAKILFTSGFADPAIVGENLSIKENLLNKPYSMKDLATRLRQVIDS